MLSLCDRTGVMVQPWLEAGYEATIVDLQHPEGKHTEGRLTKVGHDITDYLGQGWTKQKWAMVFAFPPCTHLAVSGARWWQSKGLKALIEALTVVEACRELAEATGAPYLIENPSGALSSHWRKPDYTFNPCDFGGYLDGGGDRYTKLTCLWTGGGFIMPSKRSVEPTEGSKMHLISPGPERANLRSATPEGFARAVFEANHNGPALSLFSDASEGSRC